MLWEQLAGRTAATKGADGGLRQGGICLRLILAKVCLEILELHLELFDQPGVAFGAVAELLAEEFGDLELQVPDHRIGGRNDGACLYQLVLGRGCARLCRSECRTQSIDLRGGLRHAESLPQGWIRFQQNSGFGLSPRGGWPLRSAAPVFDDLERWLAMRLTEISGKSPLAAAIRYALTRMERLRPYLDHGILNLDTDVVEQPLFQSFCGFAGLSVQALTMAA